ncbi:hypothetical protein BaRGS_00001826 [Batillaria attramentaria]|uniref:Uncharacterized protein n=1 Tax=Batillaria attramentaria TaxID=370345 RepID=A0ABD0M4W7_9CAEN
MHPLLRSGICPPISNKTVFTSPSRAGKGNRRHGSLSRSGRRPCRVATELYCAYTDRPGKEKKRRLTIFQLVCHGARFFAGHAGGRA